MWNVYSESDIIIVLSVNAEYYCGKSLTNNLKTCAQYYNISSVYTTEYILYIISGTHSGTKELFYFIIIFFINI